jgi:hypothetical protein
MQSPQEELLRLTFWPFESFFSPWGESGAETTRLPIHAALNKPSSSHPVPMWSRCCC